MYIADIHVQINMNATNKLIQITYEKSLMF